MSFTSEDDQSNRRSDWFSYFRLSFVRGLPSSWISMVNHLPKPRVLQRHVLTENCSKIIDFQIARKRYYDRQRKNCVHISFSDMTLALYSLCIEYDCKNPSNRIFANDAYGELFFIIDDEALLSDHVLARNIASFYDLLFPHGIDGISFFDAEICTDLRSAKRAMRLLKSNTNLRRRLKTTLTQVVILT